MLRCWLATIIYILKRNRRFFALVDPVRLHLNIKISTVVILIVVSC